MSGTVRDTDDRLQILVVTETFPWPVVSGYQRRLAAVLDALGAMGSVDLWTAVLGLQSVVPVVPTGAPVARTHVTGVVRRRSLPGRLFRWCTSRLPRAQLEFDARAARADLASWAAPAYDLIWCGQLRTLLWTAKAVRGPVVLDFNDLADAMLGHRRRMLRATSRGRRRWAPRAIAARAADRIDERRYQRLQRRVAHEVAAVTVCSELDRAHLVGDADVENAATVPNTYPSPDPPAVLHPPDPAAPRLLMVGLLTYAPNRDAARFFVDEVFPHVRTALPGARLRLVGHHDAALDDLGRVAGVELVGEIPDVDPELRAADLVVVPVRYGGGTRVKLLEAFAYRVPAVSTTVGCEGLDAEAGTHLLVSDDPLGIAAACVSVVRDDGLRTRLTDAAFALFHDRYRPEAAQHAITDIVRRVIASSSGSTA